MTDPVIVDVEQLARVSDTGVTGHLRRTPQDFVVEEQLSHSLDDAGEHVWLWVEKTGLTTPQAAERLAAACGLRVRDIGYAGLKDRHAVTRQWFSLAWPIKTDLPEWPDDIDLRVLVARRHGRKLKRGAHDGNRFTLCLSGLEHADTLDLDALGQRIMHTGVPNYFGEQRFGRHGDNVELARSLFAGRRLPRHRRSIALSAARSLVFNTLLDARVRTGDWLSARPGEVFMLAGTNSIFCAESGPSEEIAELQRRIDTGDIHPTGPMPGVLGPRSLRPTGQAGEQEATVLAEHAELVEGLIALDVAADRRALRLPVADWSARRVDDTLCLSFSLPPGAFATAVLREVGRFTDLQRPIVHAPDPA